MLFYEIEDSFAQGREAVEMIFMYVKANQKPKKQFTVELSNRNVDS